MLPVLAQMATWGNRHMPVSEELSIRARLLSEGGPRMWQALMDELRAEHLGTGKPRHTVRAKLQEAYERVKAKNARRAG